MIWCTGQSDSKDGAGGFCKSFRCANRADCPAFLFPSLEEISGVMLMDSSIADGGGVVKRKICKFSAFYPEK